jgi:hypothetical protein
MSGVRAIAKARPLPLQSQEGLGAKVNEILAFCEDSFFVARLPADCYR